MKTILIIIGKLTVGGAERVGFEIGYHADPSKYAIHYLVFGNEIGVYEQNVVDKGCKVLHFNPPSDGYVAYYRQLKQLIQREHYDVIHSHTMFNSGWAMMAGKACGVPVRIAHSHSIRGNEKRGFVKNLYEKTMRMLILRNATHYVACGKSAGEWLYGKKNFAKKGILIYNGIDLEQYAYNVNARKELRRNLGLEDRFVIGHAGHLAQVKNQRFLLELMPEVLKHKPNAMLLLLGEGHDRAMLEERIRQLNLTDSARLMGNVTNVGDYLSAMDVFAFPSLYEGMPLAMIEAQANGLPCVISDRIPDDIHLTQLVSALPLEDAQTSWVSALCGAQRREPESYVVKMQEMGFDTTGMLKKIYELYEGNYHEDSRLIGKNSL